MAARGNGTVGVALMRSRDTSLYVEFADMILATLAELGWDNSFRAWDGEESLLRADVLLLLGNGRGFEATANLLQRQTNRPQTILWQIEPLPPVSLTSESERLALAVESHDRSLPTVKVWVRHLKTLLPASVRGWLQNLWRNLLHRRLNKKVLAERPQDSEAPNFIIVRRYAWLKRRHAEGWLDRIFASTPAKTNFLNSRGIRAEYCPFGYHPMMGVATAQCRDIDVLFIGGVSEPRRARLLAELKQTLGEHHLHFIVVSAACFGRERAALLNRARIFLNLANYRWDISTERFLFGMACGALVVSEVLEETLPFTPGVHFIQAPASELTATVIANLRDEEKRAVITTTAARFLAEELTLARSVAALLATTP